MVAPGVYSKMTLNDNWLEDRLAPEGALTATGSFHQRGPRPTETDLAYIGERYDVLARISRMPPRLSYATPNDGFNEKLTIHKVDYVDPRNHPIFSGKKLSAPSLINTANAPVCPPEKRPLPGPESGFGAAISRHPKGHEARFWNTTHGDFFGEGSRKREPRIEPITKHASGVSSEHEEARGSGMKCGQLCGEPFIESKNPGVDTRTQRTWLAGGDAAVSNIHLGGTRPVLPKEDNELSLPLGDGAMSKVRADLKERKGRLYRTATHITKGAHLRAGISTFHDHHDG